MKKLIALVMFVSLALVGCGGGGGGGSSSTVTLSGAVLWLRSGGAPTPAATVQVGTATVPTNATDGSFVLSAPTGSTEALVIYQPTGGSPITFRFAFPALTADADLGDLIIGPEKISVTGRILDSASGTALSGVKVTLAGKSATTNSSGTYSLTDIAYDSGAPSSFLNLTGQVTATGYFTLAFNPSNTPFGGVSSQEDLFLSADSGINPPPFPYTISGLVGPAGSASGTIVQLYSGTTLVRQTTLSTVRSYGFWVEPGTYTIKFSNPTNGLSAPDQTVNLATSTDTARRDATLQ